jgi:hypothetical protein
MAKKISLTLATLVTVGLLSVALLGVSFATGLSPDYNRSSSYKQAACSSKVLELAQKGMIIDVSGYNGAIFECSQIQWAGSIYGVVLDNLL